MIAKIVVKGVLIILAVAAAVFLVHTLITDKFAALRRRAAVEPLAFATVSERERQLDCMAQNIYWEAANEPAEGKIAVAQVVVNRANSGKFPRDLCRVIYQKNVAYEHVICQFSWYCEQGKDRRRMDPELYQESMAAATKVVMEGFRLPALNNALYYHADYVNPQWRKDPVIKIGRHIFYQDHEK